MVGMFLLLSGSAFGQESDDSDLMAMSLEDLLNMEITVATGEGKKLSPRETPAIVTVITKEEIRKTGMRNLFDILRMTPGFEFAGDIWGVVGYGTRGIFASEGKILIMVDGIPFNDHLYGYPYFADQFFAETIEKVEIIRGPGSAIYGGFAELAVVNIITDKSDA
jgi:outer membrane receptor for ferrienterochelin and colicin